MRKKYFTWLIILIIISLLMSCATVITGSSEDINIQSTPKGAQIMINNVFKGETPVSINLDSRKNYFIEVISEGYQTHNEIIYSTRTNWLWGNTAYLTFGLFGLILDVASGSDYTLGKDSLDISLSMDNKFDNNNNNENVDRTKLLSKINKLNSEEKEFKNGIGFGIFGFENDDHGLVMPLGFYKIIDRDLEYRFDLGLMKSSESYYNFGDNYINEYFVISNTVYDENESIYLQENKRPITAAHFSFNYSKSLEFYYKFKFNYILGISADYYQESHFSRNYLVEVVNINNQNYFSYNAINDLNKDYKDNYDYFIKLGTGIKRRIFKGLEVEIEIPIILFNHYEYNFFDSGSFTLSYLF